MGDFKKNMIADLSNIQKYILVLLSTNNFELIKGNLWLQKELFLLSQNYDDLKHESEFEPYFLGPHSEVVEEELNDLFQAGLVNRDDSKIKLTPLGKEIGSLLCQKISNENQKFISELKEFLNDLNQDELLGFIYFSYPDMRKESIKFENIKQKRNTIALNLYQKGKISLGKAAEIAGMTIETFIHLLKQRNIEVYRE
jgi:predicted HTH domain antitoxin